MSEDTSTNKFVHLHLHTEYSLLDGINRVETLPTYIKNTLDQPAVAITDHGTLAGVYKFIKSCRKQGIAPLVGMEAYYSVIDRTLHEVDHLESKYHHLVLLAKNNNGLRNLTKLSSESYTTGMYYKPRIDDALLAEYNEDLIATSACLGSYSSQLILRGERKAAEKLLEHHAAIFKDRFFLEVQLHEDEEQQLVNKTLIEISKTKGWPLVLTADCHYTHQEDKALHEATLCMQTGDVLSNPKRFSFGPIDVHVAHHNWLWEKAQRQGIPYEALSNTLHVASMVNHETYYENRKNNYPHYKGDTQGLPHWQYLEKIAQEGLRARMGSNPPAGYEDRLAHELHIIKKMGFYDYLLIVKEFTDGARKEDVMVGPGRGSVAGSLVAYALGITEIDPIKYNLLFERWLNYGRAATPLHFDTALITKLQDLEKKPTQTGHSLSDNLFKCLEHSHHTSYRHKH